MTKFYIFKKDNKLCDGDYRIFELIEINPVVLNVIMLRANDYDDYQIRNSIIICYMLFVIESYERDMNIYELG